jgi:phage gpG-like protein
MTLKELQEKMSRLLTDVVDKQLFTDIGNKLTPEIKKRVRRGYGVSEEAGPAQKLSGLTDSYKKQRKNQKKTGYLSSETTPARSNLTQTGKMIDSITATADNKSATISVTGKENIEKAKHVQDKGRPFMNLTKREVQDVTDIIENAIKKDINKKGL